MNIKQLKYFASVAQHGSLSAAAKDQFITVQAVSKAISDLERDLNAQLFIRESRGVRLTSFGMLFLQRAEKALESFGELEEFAHRFSANQLEHDFLSLIVCIPKFPLSNAVCAGTAHFIEKQLGIKTTMQRASLAECLQALKAGDTDGIITLGSLDEPGLMAAHLGSIAPALIMAKDHPLADQSYVRLEDAKAFPFAVPETFDCFYEAVMDEYRNHPCFPENPIRDACSSAAAYKAFIKGNGLVLVAGVGAIIGRLPGICARPLAAEDARPIPVRLATLGEPRAGAIAVLVESIKNGLFKVGNLRNGDSLLRKG